MASFAPTQPAGTSDDTPQNSPTQQRQVRVLVLSPQLEVRQVLIRTLDRLSADVISCSTRTQAEEVLARQEVDLGFCDEHLPDGSYGDLIHTNIETTKSLALLSRLAMANGICISRH